MNSQNGDLSRAVGEYFEKYFAHLLERVVEYSATDQKEKEPQRLKMSKAGGNFVPDLRSIDDSFFVEVKANKKSTRAQIKINQAEKFQNFREEYSVLLPRDFRIFYGFVFYEQTSKDTFEPKSNYLLPLEIVQEIILAKPYFRKPDNTGFVEVTESYIQNVFSGRGDFWSVQENLLEEENSLLFKGYCVREFPEVNLQTMASNDLHKKARIEESSQLNKFLNYESNKELKLPFEMLTRDESNQIIDQASLFWSAK